MKYILKPLVLIVMLMAFITSVIAQPSLYVAGTHFVELSEPVRTANPNKIEVTEIFWYGCPHCYAFEPLLESWAEDLPADVDFVRNPGMWNQMMQIHAQVYYAAESLEVLDKIHLVAFEEIHQRGNYLQTEEQVKELFIREGVAEEDFDRVWNSFSVVSAVKKADSNMSAYGVRGVPNMVVNGKYRVGVGDAVASQADMLKIVSYLVEKERNGS